MTILQLLSCVVIAFVIASALAGHSVCWLVHPMMYVAKSLTTIDRRWSFVLSARVAIAAAHVLSVDHPDKAQPLIKRGREVLAMLQAERPAQ